jgi:hypothetical protein
VEKHTRYRTRMGLSQPWVLKYSYFTTINFIHTTTRGAQISFQTNVFYVRNFANGCDINMSRMRSFLSTVCGQTKRILRVRMCLMFTTVTSGLGIILMLSANMGIKPLQRQCFGRNRWGHSVGPLSVT